VGRDGAVDTEVEPQVDLVVPGESARELERSCPVGSLGLELRRGARLEQERRSGDRGPNAAETPSQIATQVQHAEVETCGCLDEHALRGTHRLTVCRGRGARRT